MNIYCPLSMSLICRLFSCLSAGYHTIHRQVLGVYDDSSEARKGHLAQQHCKNNGNILGQTSNVIVLFKCDFNK